MAVRGSVTQKVCVSVVLEQPSLHCMVPELLAAHQPLHSHVTLLAGGRQLLMGEGKQETGLCKGKDQKLQSAEIVYGNISLQGIRDLFKTKGREDEGRWLEFPIRYPVLGGSTEIDLILQSSAVQTGIPSLHTERKRR